MESYDEIFSRLSRSAFRRRIHLNAKERAYVNRTSMETIRTHAAQLLAGRLFADFIPNDGRQTPMHGHPVFVAQHATGTCCRGCLARWHGISRGTHITTGHQEFIINLIMEWISRQMATPPPVARQKKNPQDLYLF